VLQLIAQTIAQARAAGKHVSVCGEMAGDPAAALALVGLGVRSLSMSAPSLAAVRRAIRAVGLEVLETEAAAALEATTTAEVRARFSALLPA